MRCPCRTSSVYGLARIRARIPPGPIPAIGLYETQTPQKTMSDREFSDCEPPHVILTIFLCAGTPTLQQLLKALKTVENWFVFGAMLGVPVSQLKKIKSSCQGDVEVCKIEMLQYWLDNKLVPKWNDVILALEEADQLTLAAQIKREYLLSTVSEEEGMLINCVMCVEIIIY